MCKKASFFWIYSLKLYQGLKKTKLFKKADISKFSFAEMTSNSDGKTSSSGAMGVLICVVGTFCFLLGCIDKIFFSDDIDIITQSIVFVGLGAALLGYRKFKSPYFSLGEDSIETTTAILPDSTEETKCSTCGNSSCQCENVNS